MGTLEEVKDFAEWIQKPMEMRGRDWTTEENKRIKEYQRSSGSPL